MGPVALATADHDPGAPVANTIDPPEDALGSEGEPRESAEIALRRSQDRYRFLAENIPVQIWTARPDGHLDYVTEQTAKYLGVSAAQVLAEGWRNVVHPEDLPLAVERWVNALGVGHQYEVELRLKLADGSYAWHLARAIPQRDQEGAVVAWFGTNTNIDDQREEQRRTAALLVEVATMARAAESALTELRAAKAAADDRVALLEAQLAAR